MSAVQQSTYFTTYQEQLTIEGNTKDRITKKYHGMDEVWRKAASPGWSFFKENSDLDNTIPMNLTYLAAGMLSYQYRQTEAAYRREHPQPVQPQQPQLGQVEDDTKSQHEGGESNDQMHVTGLGYGRFSGVRMTIFMATTFGTAGALVARIIRLAVQVGLLPLALLYHMAVQDRYEVEGHVKEQLRRIGEEFIDLGVTLLSIPAGVIMWIKPDAFSGTMQKVQLYYLKRMDKRTAHNIEFSKRVNDYDIRIRQADRNHELARRQRTR